MPYSDEEILTRDLDWFIVINDIPFHFASDGGALPNIIINRKEQNEKVIKSIPSLEKHVPANEIIINPNLKDYLNLRGLERDYLDILNALFPEGMKTTGSLDFNFRSKDDTEELGQQACSIIRQSYINDVYSLAFLKFSSMGFVSMDRTYNPELQTPDMYHWVSKPNDFKYCRIVAKAGKDIDFDVPQVSIDQESFDDLLKENATNQIDIVQVLNSLSNS